MFVPANKLFSQVTCKNEVTFVVFDRSFWIRSVTTTIPQQSRAMFRDGHRYRVRTIADLVKIIYVYSEINIPLYYYFSGNFMRSNVIEEFNPVYSAAECQNNCQKHRGRGCKYFVWEANDFDCTLYSGLSGLEYDKDDQGKWLGPVDGCIGCHREGWDYIQDRAPENNLVGNGNVGGVTNVYKCAQVCQFTNDCKYAR